MLQSSWAHGHGNARAPNAGKEKEENADAVGHVRQSEVASTGRKDRDDSAVEQGMGKQRRERKDSAAAVLEDMWC